MGCPPQRPPEEQARYRAITRSALIRKNIAAAGVPDVTAVWAHEVGGSRMLLGVSIKQRYAGHSKQAGHVAAMCHAGAYAGKYVIVVDDDIDVSNLEELMWAMLTRSDPATSIDIITKTWSTPLDPRMPPEQKDAGDNTNSRAIIDACRPFHWRDRFPKVNMPSAETARTGAGRSSATCWSSAARGGAAPAPSLGHEQPVPQALPLVVLVEDHGRVGHHVVHGAGLGLHRRG